MKLWSMLLGAVVAAILVVGVTAEEKKEVTLKGTLVCAKCTLKETKACCNVLKVKEGDKEVQYYLSPADGGTKAAYHKGVCPPGSEKEATVKGTVTKKGGKLFIDKGAEVKVD